MGGYRKHPLANPDGAEVIHVSASGGEFHWVQDAIDYASVQRAGLPTIIKVSPHPSGRWEEDVLLRIDDIHLKAQMGGGIVTIKSLTLSDCTEASIAAFRASNDRTLLVRDPTLGANFPKVNSIEGMRFDRSVNNPVWGTGAPGGDDACSSVLVLGSDTANSDFGNETFGFVRCFLEQAAGGVDGFGGLYACMADVIGFHQQIGGGGMRFVQCNQQFILQSNIFGATEINFDKTTPGVNYPTTGFNSGPIWLEGFSFLIRFTGLDGRCGPPPPDFGMVCGVRTSWLLFNGPQITTPSQIGGMSIRDIIQIVTGDVMFDNSRYQALSGPGSFVVGAAGSGAICRWNGGRYKELPTVDAGPPASQFIETVGYGS